MRFVPTASDEVANIADPELSRFTVLSKVAPSHKSGFPSRVNPAPRVARAPAAEADARNRAPPSSDPTQKLTLPSGEPAGAGATVAVKVTDCPMPAGFGLAESVVVVGTALLIISLMLFEIDEADAAFPE